MAANFKFDYSKISPRRVKEQELQGLIFDCDGTRKFESYTKPLESNNLK